LEKAVLGLSSLVVSIDLSVDLSMGFDEVGTLRSADGFVVKEPLAVEWDVVVIDDDDDDDGAGRFGIGIPSFVDFVVDVTFVAVAVVAVFSELFEKLVGSPADTPVFFRLALKFT